MFIFFKAFNGTNLFDGNMFWYQIQGDESREGREVGRLSFQPCAFIGFSPHYQELYEVVQSNQKELGDFSKLMPGI